MSPEQASGHPVDFRSDQFSLGAILYEMAAGKRAFDRPTPVQTLSAVIQEEPEPLSSAALKIPANLVWMIERCLAKDPEERYASTKDLARDLAALRDHASAITAGEILGEAVGAERGSRRRAGTWPIAVVGALAGLGIATVFSYVAYRRKTPSVGFTVERLTRLPGVEGEPAIAPDGKSVVYVRNGDIWLLRVGGSHPINLTADSPMRDFAPAFSPDGERIAFSSDRDGGGIFLMGATGEDMRRITTRGSRPAWTADGRELVFVFNDNDLGYKGMMDGQGLKAVEVATGRIRSLCDTCAASAPAASPHGLMVAFWGIEPRGGRAQRDLWAVPLAGLGHGQNPIRLTDDMAYDWGPRWSPDGRSLFFVSDRGGSPNLWKLPIDERSGRALGAAEPLILPASFVATVQGAADGRTLVYQAMSRSSEFARVAFDPVSGSTRGSIEVTLRLGDLTPAFSSASFSPDGQWLAVQGGPRGDVILVLKADGSVVRRLVEDPYRKLAPAWSPDGKTIAFATDRAGKYEIWGITPDGGNPRPLVVSDQRVLGPVWSPDAMSLLASEQTQGVPWCTVIYRLQDPPHQFERLPELPNGDRLDEGGIWVRGGEAIIGPGWSGSIWEWSMHDRTYRKLLETGPGVYVIAELARGRLLLGNSLSSVGRVELFDPATGERRPVVSDEARFAALSPDRKSLWLNRQREEADLWLARLEGGAR